MKSPVLHFNKSFKMSAFVNDSWIFTSASALRSLLDVLEVEAYKENPAGQGYVIGKERSLVGLRNVSQGLGLPGPDIENISCRMISAPSSRW